MLTWILGSSWVKLSVSRKVPYNEEQYSGVVVAVVDTRQLLLLFVCSNVSYDLPWIRATAISTSVLRLELREFKDTDRLEPLV
jgi:hypothetical protein